MAYQFEFKDLENLYALFQQGSKEWLDKLDALQTAINSFASDGNESAWYDEARNYLNETYTIKIIPALKELINQHNTEFQNYMQAFEAVKLGTGTKVDEKELKALCKNIKKPSSDLTYVHDRAKGVRSKAKKAGVEFTSKHNIKGIETYRKGIADEADQILSDIKGIDDTYKSNCKDRNEALTSMGSIYNARKKGTFDMSKANYSKMQRFFTD